MAYKPYLWVSEGISTCYNASDPLLPGKFRKDSTWHSASSSICTHHHDTGQQQGDDFATVAKMSVQGHGRQAHVGSLIKNLGKEAAACCLRSGYRALHCATMMGHHPVLMLSQNIQHESGRKVQSGNINASKTIADIIQTCLGPKSMMKMFLDSTGVIVMTYDGNAIL
ncbi:hypothetical protein QTO34_018224 [Cnephaeus nilssonii]|uniref:Uncharacterized protein n=1 Tax=Cnephaeus nilssonii TaxID=3371016 RepID=A0AA40HYI9_CNENI|nr:hypothetical protein QTO34_018224 [Eptesicus nilssonii]